MTWIKLDASVHKHHKLAALPSNDARWAFVVTLCEGKAWGGVWHSRAHYQTCVGSLAKHLDALVGVGLMELDEDGTVSVHDWPDYQRDVDPNAAERARRYRERRSSRVTGRDVTAANGPNSTVHTVRDVHTGRTSPAGEDHGSRNPENDAKSRALAVLQNPTASESMKEAAKAQLDRLGYVA